METPRRSPSRKLPQPFEVALVRKLESRTSSVRDAFLLLDIDGDGLISRSDVRTSLHNMLELDITKEQEGWIFEGGSSTGMGYAAFARYFEDVSEAAVPMSQSGMAATAGFCRDDDGKNVSGERPISLPQKMLIRQKRHQLRRILTAHSSRESPGKMGMKETSLFLAMDASRNGKVTMKEFLDWLDSIGMDWSLNDLKLAVLGCDKKDDRGWFKGKRAGMTERDFARLVESLDKDYPAAESRASAADSDSSVAGESVAATEAEEDELLAKLRDDTEVASLADTDSAVAGESVAATEAEEDYFSSPEEDFLADSPVNNLSRRGNTSISFDAATDASVAGSSVAATEVEEDVLVNLGNLAITGSKVVVLTKNSSLDISICDVGRKKGSASPQ